jgi:aryl-alcohol dehydrogenase-like predicted oxidoreductase
MQTQTGVSFKTKLFTAIEFMQKNNEHALSRLTLGTVQFGLAYGIANQGGKPAYETCREIMAEAYAAGIRCFDTAAAYGESESVLGRALAELGIADAVTLVSKSRPLDPTIEDPTLIKQQIEASLQDSLKHLRVEQLPVFLFHREADLRWMEILAALRERGLIARIGVSVDTAAGAESAAAEPLVVAVQLPHNLFDHRFSAGPWFQSKSADSLLFARSAFLQGLLLMPEARIPAALHVVIPARRRIEQLAAEAGMTMPELCLRYSLSFPAIDSVLIGVDSVAQLKENIAIAAKGPLPTDLIEQIHAAVPDFPETIVRPALWPK